MNSEATEIYHPSPATAMSDETKTDPPPSSVDSTIWMLSQQLQPKQDLARIASFILSMGDTKNVSFLLNSQPAPCVVGTRF